MYVELGGAGGVRSSRHACRSACDVRPVVGRPVLLSLHYIEASCMYGRDASLKRRHLAGQTTQTLLSEAQPTFYVLIQVTTRRAFPSHLLPNLPTTTA